MVWTLQIYANVKFISLFIYYTRTTGISIILYNSSLSLSLYIYIIYTYICSHLNFWHPCASWSAHMRESACSRWDSHGLWWFQGNCTRRRQSIFEPVLAIKNSDVLSKRNKLKSDLEYEVVNNPGGHKSPHVGYKDNWVNTFQWELHPA
jgi:hypothetical protein